ncbi:arsenic resistance N-acetyltransferase ArsN2 [Ensifer soli]|uniref:arsenic resistance N-acetyltransferase ArsN2 n=1 Tax=Ciceribacter sp. sgz301302 TaxID=3342379 RepID=UPI0035BA8E99
MSQPLTIETVPGGDDGLRTALATARLPVDDLDEPGRVFYHFLDDGRTVGFGGLERHGAYALLRSVVVPAEQQGKGFGRAITQELLDQAHDAGIGAVYLLTESAARFFTRLGFRAISRDLAPAAILATRQAAGLCPASATLMVKDLTA